MNKNDVPSFSALCYLSEYFLESCYSTHTINNLGNMKHMLLGSHSMGLNEIDGMIDGAVT
jgi:hypothetical protein